jgi:hypothetical protein
VQYFGDVNDYRKYALLRLLAKSGGFKIGVCWMLTTTDDRPDGNKRAYAEQPAKWRAFDPNLFDLLATVKRKPDLADLLRIESEGLIPGAIFVNEMVPDSLEARLAFHQACLSAFDGCDLAFFDPTTVWRCGRVQKAGRTQASSSSETRSRSTMPLGDRSCSTSTSLVSIVRHFWTGSPAPSLKHCQDQPFGRSRLRTWPSSS